MYDWQSFDVVFDLKPEYTPDHKSVETAQRHRKELGGALFFDRIWTSLGLKSSILLPGDPYLWIHLDLTCLFPAPKPLYPARTNQDLRTLWSTICSKATAPTHQRQSLLFYLLLSPSRALPAVLKSFADGTYLPPKYQTLIRGLWELDHLHFQAALDFLTDPILTPATFPDEILKLLLSHPKCDDALAMAYYLTVKPPLRDAETKEMLFRLLCQTSVVEAMNFTRKQAEPGRRQLFETVLVSVHNEPPSAGRAERARTLLSLPLTTAEGAWFEDCLLRGAGKNCAEARDSVLVRRIVMGQSVDNIAELRGWKGKKIDGVGWDDIRQSMSRALIG